MRLRWTGVVRRPVSHPNSSGHTQRLILTCNGGQVLRRSSAITRGDDDILTAMARELVTEQAIREWAEAVWRRLQTEHSRALPPPSLVLRSPALMPRSRCPGAALTRPVR